MRTVRHIATAVAACAVISGCAEEPSAGPRGGWGGAAKVVTHQVDLQPIVDEIEALGTARANESVEITATVTETVRNWQSYIPDRLPMPHPSPRNNLWLRKNPWFEAELLPELRRRVAQLTR